MKYFLDTEFLEGTQNKTFLGINTGKTKPTIDLISIGIVAEDGREYYAISNEFNLKEAWNRFQLDEWKGNPIGKQEYVKKYWIRDNVLLQIYVDKVHGDMRNHSPFSYNMMKHILKTYGKSNKQIADEIIEFCKPIIKTDRIAFTSGLADVDSFGRKELLTETKEFGKMVSDKRYAPEFYGYYADYDWVAFCWLFGKMIDLPKGFPMYCIDLKQILDNKAMLIPITNRAFTDKYIRDFSHFDERLQDIKKCPYYPKQTNEHNALADAKWNYKLYKFLESI